MSFALLNNLSVLAVYWVSSRLAQIYRMACSLYMTNTNMYFKQITMILLCKIRNNCGLRE